MQALLARFKAAPLSNGFFFAGILGFIVTAVYYQYGKLDVSLAFTFMLFFAIVFFASMISMSRAPVAELMKINKNLIKTKAAKKQRRKK